jgi:hypothetical protein
MLTAYRRGRWANMRRVMAKHSQNIPMINVRVSQIHDGVSPNTIISSWWSLLAQPRSSCSRRTAELPLAASHWRYLGSDVDWSLQP